MDSIKLIAEVEKRPYLWKIPKGKRRNKKLAILWKQVSKRVGSSESSCRTRWSQLRFLYVTRKKRAEKNPNCKKSWKYLKHLKFLDDRNVVPKEEVTINKRELIAKVKERPYLWEIPNWQRKKNTATKLWTEVADHVGVSVNKCKETWCKIRWKYKKCSQDREKGKSQYFLYEDLEFLSGAHDGANTKPAQMDKFDLIAKVKETPYLWQVPSCRRNKSISLSLWKNIADNFGIEAKLCKKLWYGLRGRYQHHKKQKDLLSQSSKKHIYNWKYFDSMKFLSGLSDEDVPEVKVDRLDLIALIKRQPELWKVERCSEKKEAQWKEIAKTLGADANVCKIQWRYLYLAYRKKKKREKQTGRPCTWEYYEHLKFLDEITAAEANDTFDKVDKFELIAKVKERPPLWTETKENRKTIIQLWKEVCELLDISYVRCRKIWWKLCDVYKKHREVEENLLETSIKYCSKWEYYDHLKFLHNVDDKAPEMVNRFVLIAKVKENPKLWNPNEQTIDKNTKTEMWIEIAECLEAQEQTCRNAWMDLRLLYFKHKEKRERQCKWIYYDVLKFLDEEAQTSDVKKELCQIDKLKLINEVKERPYLWTTEPKSRNKLIWEYNWLRVSEALNLAETQCELEWNELLALYKNEKDLIERFKQKGEEDKTKNTRNGWKYFEYLRFLDNEKNNTSSKAPEAQTSDVKKELCQIDKLKLITEVKSRPYLWTTESKSRNKLIWEYNWSRVSEVLDQRETHCELEWNDLVAKYKNEKDLIEWLKQKGEEDETENTKSEWEYFEYLRFLDADKSNPNSKAPEDVASLPLSEKRVRLLNAVEERPYLWKKETKGDRKMNMFLWSEVSKLCGLELKLCKSKYQNLKLHFKKKYALFKANKLDIETFRDFPNYEHYHFLHEILDKELEAEATAAGSDDPEKKLSSKRPRNLLESVCVKEEPQMQCSSLISVPLKSIDKAFIKEEVMELKEPDEFCHDITIKKEDTSEDETESNNRYNITQNEKLKCKVKEEPNMSDIFTIEEFKTDVKERQTNQVENIENISVKKKPSSEITDRVNNLAPVKEERSSEDANENTATCAVIKTEHSDDEYLTNFVKSEETSDFEFISDLPISKTVISTAIRKREPPINSQAANKRSRNSQLEDSTTDIKEDKAELSKGQKCSNKKPNATKVANKKSKKNK